MYTKKKKKKLFIFLILFFLILFFIEPKKNEEFSHLKGIDDKKHTLRIPIFGFHRLVPDEIKKKIYPNNQWVGSINIFEEMIKYIYNNEYKTLSIEEFYKWYRGEVEYNKKTILITIDDGHYEDYYLVYPIIKKYNFKATSFVVGSRIKNKTSPYNKYKDSFIGIDVINKVSKEYPNFKFQSHSYNMHCFTRNNKGQVMNRIYSMSEKEIEDDFIKNKKYGFTAMAYPYGLFNEEVIKLLEKYGYFISFGFGPYTYASRNCNRFVIPRIKLNGDSTILTLKYWLRNI